MNRDKFSFKQSQRSVIAGWPLRVVKSGAHCRWWKWKEVWGEVTEGPNREEMNRGLVARLAKTHADRNKNKNTTTHRHATDT